MSLKTSLYFIALLPPEPLKSDIQQLKQEVKEKFQSSHSLNAPPHITLISPFHVNKGDLPMLRSMLEGYAQKSSVFEIKLENFSSFPPRVVFINVAKSEALIRLRQKLEELIRSEPVFSYNYQERPYQPHITLAFKDLTKSNFYRAWDEFKTRRFDASFRANELSLLKHTGEYWEIEERFPFG